MTKNYETTSKYKERYLMHCDMLCHGSKSGAIEDLLSETAKR